MSWIDRITDHPEKVLVGATIIAVPENLYPDDGICVIEKDGTQYILYSNDLGWWLEPVPFCEEVSWNPR